MGMLRSLFGLNQEEMWRQLAAEIGAAYVPGKWWSGQQKVMAHVGDWILTLDTYTVSTGESSVTYTRMRAPFINRDGFRLKFYRAGWFTELGKLLGTQDLTIGDPAFDQAFVIQGNNETRVRELFADPRIRGLAAAQPTLCVSIQDDEGWFRAKFPEGVDALSTSIGGIVTDVPRLRGLFDLFAAILHRLTELDPAYGDPAAAHLQALQGPGGQIASDDVVIWDGDPARRAAAEALGRMREPGAVAPLIQALGAPDAGLRSAAAWSLGEIGAPEAAPALVPLLGDEAMGGGLDAGQSVAAEALRKLGQSELVAAFCQGLEGNLEAVPVLQGVYRPAVVEALGRLIESGSRRALPPAAALLGELGVVEALPRLKARHRKLRGEAGPAPTALSAAIDRLESHAALPLPSASAAIDPASLPVPSSAGE